MSGFLNNLAARGRGTLPTLTPRRPAPFEGLNQPGGIEAGGEVEVMPVRNEAPGRPVSVPATPVLAQPLPLQTVSPVPRAMQKGAQPVTEAIHAAPSTTVPTVPHAPGPVAPVVPAVPDMHRAARGAEASEIAEMGIEVVVEDSDVASVPGRSETPASWSAEGKSGRDGQEAKPGAVSPVSAVTPAVTRVAPKADRTAPFGNEQQAAPGSREPAPVMPETPEPARPAPQQDASPSRPQPAPEPPAPLLAARPVRQAGGSHMRDGASRTSRKAAEPPSVEIVIGSVDVAMPPQTPAPAPKAPAPSRGMSLDAFLNGEAGG